MKTGLLNIQTKPEKENALLKAIQTSSDTFGYKSKGNFSNLRQIRPQKQRLYLGK